MFIFVVDHHYKCLQILIRMCCCSSLELSLNKWVYYADITLTQLEALALFEKYTNTK